MLKIEIKTFNELTIDLLYSLLQLRSEVFVVEQEIVYQDIDGKDQKALHVLGFKDNQLIAYTRIFKPGDYFDKAAIGRVLVKENQRKFNYGKEIMNASIKAVEDYYRETSIKISAQKYLLKFYSDLGFKAYGEEYLEDTIPHMAMIRKENL